MSPSNINLEPVPQTGSATFSDCGNYRYLLTRKFKTGKGTALFVMLNPSTADANVDDPTIKRCSAFTKRWGFAELRVVNLFALRSTDPRHLGEAADPIGPENDAVLRRELVNNDTVIAAWGNNGALNNMSTSIDKMLVDLEVQPECLGINKTGEPVHPLYVAADALPVRFMPRHHH